MVLLDAAPLPLLGDRVGRPIHYTGGFISFMNYPIGANMPTGTARLGSPKSWSPRGADRAALHRPAESRSASTPGVAGVAGSSMRGLVGHRGPSEQGTAKQVLHPENRRSDFGPKCRQFRASKSRNRL
jgi:hypothetical protein